MTYVVLDRVESIRQTDTPYCLHGRVTCSTCKEWCWLGSRTLDVVLSGEADPLCHQCANLMYPPDKRPGAVLGHLKDHLRRDGPHE